MRFRSLVIGAALLAVPARAGAHHVVSEVGVTPVEPRTSAEIVVETGRFDLGSQSGSWQALTPSLEVAFLPRLSLRARVPVARIAFDDGRTVSGLADVELAAKVRLYAPGHGGPMLSAGFGTELPTGDVDDGLGGGHVELVPFVAGAHEGTLGSGHWIAVLVVSDRIAVGGHHQESLPRVPRHGGIEVGAVHGSPIAPHTAHELVTSLTATWLVEHAYVSAGSELVLSFDPDAGASPVIARVGAGWIATRRVRLIAGVDLPVAGDERFEWKARAGLSTAW